ncbi:hypothetical protein GCM10010357_07210 [Streptomyces luteireticuli]|uniref:Dyp-type peroxidase n=2 Tax=Streptomyces luteireticuli TaxID=173858 RepID=A0ABN0YAK2_9ACTN
MACRRTGADESGATEEGAPRQAPAQLRGPAPAPHVCVMALDLRGDVPDRAMELRRLARAVGGSGGIALGAGLLGGGAGRPRHLRRMPTFPGDLLDPSASHGDVLVQIEGRSRSAAAEASDRLLRAVPAWKLRWRIDGFLAGSRTERGRALTRDPFQFTEGFGNPPTEREVRERCLVRPGQGEPSWAVGGSYQVIRLVRLATELWDRDSQEEQERVIGRRRNGRWLDGTPAEEEPDFRADPKGRVTPLTSHVRMAAPDRRNPPPLVRRSYGYDRGDGDTGMIFSCFQRDLAAGFETVQRRLEGQELDKYVLTFGGGYFFVPPSGDAWVEAALR